MRTAIKAALSVTIDQIRRDYYGLLDQHLSSLLAIYEQDSRNEKERKRILIADIRAIGSRRIEYTAAAADIDYLDWLDDLIEGHITQVLEIGVSFPANHEIAIDEIDKGFSWGIFLMNGNPKLKRHLSECGWMVSKDDEATYKFLSELRESRKPEKEAGEIATPRGSSREKRYFRYAIDAGWMERRGNGYFWNGSRASLCRFLGLLYPTGTPFKALESLFTYNRDGRPAKVVRLDVGIPAAMGSKLEPEIDNLFKNKE